MDKAGLLPLLGRLVDQSLVVTESGDEVARYRLLQTVRQYARGRLDQAGERVLVEARHRDWYRRWAEAHDPERAVAAGEQALERFDAELDNLRTALRSALVDEPEAALRLAISPVAVLVGPRPFRRRTTLARRRVGGQPRQDGAARSRSALDGRAEHGASPPATPDSSTWPTR